MNAKLRQYYAYILLLKNIIIVMLLRFFQHIQFFTEIT